MDQVIVPSYEDDAWVDAMVSLIARSERAVSAVRPLNGFWLSSATKRRARLLSVCRGQVVLSFSDEDVHARVTLTEEQLHRLYTPVQ